MLNTTPTTEIPANPPQPAQPGLAERLARLYPGQYVLVGAMVLRDCYKGALVDLTSHEHLRALLFEFAQEVSYGLPVAICGDELTVGEERLPLAPRPESLRQVVLRLLELVEEAQQRARAEWGDAREGGAA